MKKKTEDEKTRGCGESMRVQSSDNCPDLGNHDVTMAEKWAKPAATHTPTPWKYSQNPNPITGGFLIDAEKYLTAFGGGKKEQVEIEIGHVLQETDAAFIVRAVNAHEALLAVLKDINRFFENGKTASPSALYGDAKNPITLAQAVTRAIQNAEGK